MSSIASETELQTSVEELARRAKAASRRLATLSRERRDEVLRAAAEALSERASEIVEANARS